MTAITGHKMKQMRRYSTENLDCGNKQGRDFGDMIRDAELGRFAVFAKEKTV